MSNWIDAAFGIHTRALAVGAKRLELIAGNLANSDTPGFKARDIDFREVLQGETDSGLQPLSLRTTEAGHQAGGAASLDGEALYRVPNHPSLDGNTVDTELEQSAFAEATVRYQASLDFLAGRIDALRKALRGE
ncbi:MAG TPA: flagellar basal body rod protein FlgB [Gammaproteobacteria bacterium]|nr:flagellar basal body rod protein FlgB [Gammaproteobacteria bacterium]